MRLSAPRLWIANFWLLCAGMAVMGMYTAFGKYYRFAAADAASSEFRAKAISLTLAGGVFGPETAKFTRELFAGYEFLGSYLSLALICLVAMLLLTRLDIPGLSEHERKDSGRPIGEIMRQPVFIVAALGSMLSYGIMIFVTMAISSLSSGVLLQKSGWQAVNYGSIPFLALAAGATLWLMWRRRAP